EDLKSLIRRRIHGRKEAEVAFNQHEVQPDVWEPALRYQLAQTGADRDEEILEAARLLMALVDPPGAAEGKYQVQFTGPVQGVVIGDSAHVTQTFGHKPPEA